MNKVVTAYVYDRLFQGMPDEDAARVTQVNYSFALIKEGRADVSHWAHEAGLVAFMKRHPGLSVGLSVGGWQADGFSQATASEEGRERLAESIAGLVRRYGFHGIDLDWEYPGNSIAGIASSPEDITNFPLFVNLLRSKLDKNCSLTLAVGATQECVKGIRYHEMAGAIDRINLMSYDLAPWGQDSPTTHHAALYTSAAAGNVISTDSAVTAYHQAGVPLHKLVLGIAFYGRFHSGVKRGDSHGLNQPHESEFPNGMRYREIKERLEGGARRYWDMEAKAPYLYDPAGALFVTYEDAESIACKTRYALEKELGGVMFWEYLGEDTRELLVAVDRGMKR